MIGYSVTGGVAVAPTAGLVGLVARSVAGTTSTDTILYSDSNDSVEYQGSVAVAVTVPTATTLGNPHFYSILDNLTTGSSTALTVTPTTWTINGNSTLVIANGQKCRISLDPNSSTNWLGLEKDSILSVVRTVYVATWQGVVYLGAQSIRRRNLGLGGT
jgi:hypothetical protein